ncbi:MAG: ligase-associated DNA damage response exonuclease [Dokdonella sp.]
MRPSDLIELRPEGLYCPAGRFHVDPWRPVADAIITHAHGDHARSGSASYRAAAVGLDILAERIGEQAPIQALEYGEKIAINAAVVSLHPAGHILGSSQVRIEVDGRVCVVSGDYKRAADPTCLPFEVVPCDVFVTEATFGLPVYRWPPISEVAQEMLAWWDACREKNQTAVLCCYALGKAQRVLAELARYTNRTVHLHGAMLRLTERYRDAGIAMLPTEPVMDSAKGRDFSGELIIAPPSAAGSPWIRRFGNASLGFASGWMQVRGNRRRRGWDRGFVVSDHADWPALIDTVRSTGAQRILPTHGNTDALVAYLCEQGFDAEPLHTEFGGDD